MTTAAILPPVDASTIREPAGIRDYSVFGGTLRSEIEFPELSISTIGGLPDWSVVVDDRAPSTEEWVLVGERQIREERYELWRSCNGLRLVYSHAGTFDIARDGSRIVWYYRADALPELVRSIIIGPAISLALELAGFLCLHGSAVAIGDSAVAFVGPKHFGKSTLAVALTAAGARLIGDDLLVVSAGPPATIRPGVASVRLWADMTTALPLGAICETLIPGVKTTATGFAGHAVAAEPTPLRAIYALSPVQGAPDVPTVRRNLLSPSEATIALAHQTKLPPSLVGLRGAGTQLAASAALAATVPVWTLYPVRDVARLGPLVSQIIEWSSVE
ncbi:MAG TPA: hypothetical protein VGH98_18675 [Gemmatimonadaceae bacterium]